MPAPEEPLLDRVDATIRWLIAYRALATGESRPPDGSDVDRPSTISRPTAEADPMKEHLYARLLVAAGVALIIVGVAQRVV